MIIGTVPFSDDMGNLLMGGKISSGEMDLMSPDNTSEGVLVKKWKIIDGRRYLVKGGSMYRQEPVNEAVASILADALKIEHVPYVLAWEGGDSVSICSDFVDPDIDYVSAHHVLNTVGGSDSVYNRYVRGCSAFGIDIVPFLDRMIVFDYLIDNGDRHLNNFGLIRNAVTLEWIGPAPLFDNGSSLGHNVPTERFGMDCRRYPKPFKKTYEEQLRLVTDMSWYDPDTVDAVMPKVEEVLSQSDTIEPIRREAIIRLMSDGNDRLRRMCRGTSGLRITFPWVYYK